MRLTFSNLYRREDGVAMIEMAIVLPVLLALVIGVMEYGVYFLKSQTNTNNVAAAAQAVMNDPGDPSNRDLLSQTELINHEENTVCADSFLTMEAAKAGDCAHGQWYTFAPEDMPEEQTAYFVLIKSDAYSASMTGLFDGLVPTNTVRQVVKVYEGGEEGPNCNGVSLYGQWACKYIPNEHDVGEFGATNSFFIPFCTENGWSCPE